MTIKTLEELAVDFAEGQLRGIVSEKVRDLIDSTATVFGVMNTTDEQTQNITPSYQPLTIWTNSDDARGLQADLVNGVYDVKKGGLGQYLMVAVLNFKMASPVVTWGATALNGATGSYRHRKLIGTDEDQLIVWGVRNAKFVNDPVLDTIGIKMKHDGAGSILATFDRSVFFVLRIGPEA